jgi:hypothetical protein
MALIQEKQLSSALQAKIDSPNATSIQSVAVSSSAPASGQVLGYNGTQWAPITPSGGGAGNLQAAYDIGASIAIGANGAVAISNSSQATSLLTLSKSEVNGGDVQSITNAGTGHGLLITNSNSGNALRVVQNTTNAEVIRVVKNSTGAGNLLYLNNKGTGTTLNIYNESTACAITITSSAAGSVTCVDIANTSTGAGIHISQNGAGYAIDIAAGASVALNIAQSNNNGLVTFSKSGSGAGDVMSITNAGTGKGLYISNSIAGGGRALDVSSASTGSYAGAFASTGNIALYATTSAATAAAYFVNTGSSAGGYACQIAGGSGDAALYVAQSNAKQGIYVVQTGASYALQVTSNASANVCYFGQTGAAITAPVEYIAYTYTQGYGTKVECGVGGGTRYTEIGRPYNSSDGWNYFYRNVSGDSGPIVKIFADHASDAQNCLEVLHHGTGHCIDLNASTATANAHIGLSSAIAPSSNGTGDLYRCSTDSLDSLAYYNGTVIWRHNVVPRVDFVSNTTIDGKYSGCMITNNGAAGSITLTLPTPVPGMWFIFVRVTAQTLNVKCAQWHSLYYINGAQYGNESSTVGQASTGTSYTLLCIYAMTTAKWGTAYINSGWSYSAV